MLSLIGLVIAFDFLLISTVFPLCLVFLFSMTHNLMIFIGQGVFHADESRSVPTKTVSSCLTESMHCFGNEGQYATALETVQWSESFQCPQCGYVK